MPLSRTRLLLGVALAVCTTATAACGGQYADDPMTPVVVSSPVPAATVAPVDPIRPRSGPADPQVGVAYPFDLYTHCGIQYAQFGGRLWETSPSRDEPQARAGTHGPTRYTGYTAGAMTLVGTDAARFVIDVRYAVTDEPAVTFFPATKELTPCK